MFYVLYTFEGRVFMARSKPFENLAAANTYKGTIHPDYSPFVTQQV